MDARKAFWIERMFEKWKINIPAGKQEGEASQIKRNAEILIKIPAYQEINKTRICGGKIHETDRFIKTD